ncbi:MAG: RNA polymerase sigma factor [Planctomycetota bacterium]|jgi:RNA polymerase sigma-70 factor (ECF subfamily)
MTDEAEVIRQVLQGDVESFRLLLERYERPVVRMIRNMAGDTESCEDIAQEVFFTAYTKLASFDAARGEFSAWLFTIARNKSINALKKKRALPMSELPGGADCRDPADFLARKEVFAELDRVLQALPMRHRRAFVLAEFEKLPYENIAQIEGAKLGTIKSRINRAKKKLRSALRRFEADIV